ncbi:MAG TPA: riboflavin synthase [Bryobacteraceae bacterium]|nr:riboflavin synthase [Bryobacteraceae bacterium]
MFTGIIEEIGVLEAVLPAQGGARLRLRAQIVMADLKEGDSVSVSGVCLTAVELRRDGFSADVSPETIKRSTLGGLTPGSFVNLERALTPSTRIGGHVVQGHVDGVGEIEAIEQVSGEYWWLTVRAGDELDRYLVEKGSVAVDGISLTIAEVEDGRFSVAVIPHTIAQTTLKHYRAGSRVNIETDVLAKYVEKLLRASASEGGRLTVDRLREMGW